MSKRPTTVDQLEQIAANKLATARGNAQAAVDYLQEAHLNVDEALTRTDIVLSLLNERRGLLDAVALLKQAQRRDAQPEAAK